MPLLVNVMMNSVCFARRARLFDTRVAELTWIKQVKLDCICIGQINGERHGRIG